MDTLKNIENLGLTSNTRLYHGAPYCFMALTSQSVFVEQYHYGRIHEAFPQLEKHWILGGDVPLVEYARFEENEQDAQWKDPYQLYLDSFEFVWDYLSLSVAEFTEKQADLEKIFDEQWRGFPTAA